MEKRLPGLQRAERAAGGLVGADPDATQLGRCIRSYDSYVLNNLTVTTYKILRMRPGRSDFVASNHDTHASLILLFVPMAPIS